MNFSKYIFGWLDIVTNIKYEPKNDFKVDLGGSEKGNFLGLLVIFFKSYSKFTNFE